MDEGLVAMAIVGMLFIGLPAVVLHYVTQWRKSGSLKPGDEHMIEDLWRAAGKFERRIEALEAILDAESPGWRRRHEDALSARAAANDARRMG